MPKPTQVPVQFTPPQLSQLRHRSQESGRSIAALVREAVARYLDPVAPPLEPSALWAVLRDPAHWATFRLIATEMEARTASAAPSDPLPAEPAPVYRHQRPAGVSPRQRNNPPPPLDEEKPF